jgi:hypothetical protein
VTGPEVTALDSAVYIIPTDAPEADGTLAWDKTTMVLVTAQAGGQRGIGWSYTSAAATTVVTEVLANVATGATPSTSMITSGSSGCCSTAPSTRAAGPRGPTTTGPDTA